MARSSLAVFPLFSYEKWQTFPNNFHKTHSKTEHSSDKQIGWVGVCVCVAQMHRHAETSSFHMAKCFQSKCTAFAFACGGRVWLCALCTVHASQWRTNGKSHFVRRLTFFSRLSIWIWNAPPKLFQYFPFCLFFALILYYSKHFLVCQRMGQTALRKSDIHDHFIDTFERWTAAAAHSNIQWEG